MTNIAGNKSSQAEAVQDVWIRLVENYAVAEEELKDETRGLEGQELLDRLYVIERIVQPIGIVVNGVPITPPLAEQMASLRRLANERGRVAGSEPTSAEGE